MIVFYSSAKVHKWVCQHGIHQCWICWFSWFCYDVENVVLVSWHFPDILENFWKSHEICVCLAQEREMHYIQLMELSLLLLQLLVKYSFSFTHIIIQFSFIQCHIKEFIVLSLMCLSGVCFFNLLKYYWLDILICFFPRKVYQRLGIQQKISVLINLDIVILFTLCNHSTAKKTYLQQVFCTLG